MSEYVNNGMGSELSWDAEIQNDNDFTLLPEGDYNFKVTGFERQRYEGSAKLPPCNKAELTLEVTDGVQKAYIKHNLYLHTVTEGLLCAFFTAIGQRKHGEKLVPRWNEVIGSTGTLKLKIRKFTSRKGEEMEANQVDKFYEKNMATENNTMAAPSMPSWKKGF